MMWRRTVFPGTFAGALGTAVLLTAFGTGHAAQAPENDVQSAFGSSEMISLATGYRQSLVEAPATARIITRAEIDRLAPRSLADILDHVAGLRVVPSSDGRGTVTVERGRDRTILFLVDGIPYVKGLIFGWQDLNDVLPYDIERIEVVLGPASAVYGANAAGGVVNIITRSGSGFTGVETGARVGSFDSYDGWLEAGERWHDVSLNFYAGYRSSDQTDATIERDAQTTFDQIFHTHASLAPGPLAGHRDVTEARATAETGPWKLTLAEFAETDFHVGAGVAEALDPNGIYDNRLDSADLTYQHPLEGNWEVDGYLSYSRVWQTGHTALYPPGAFGGLFPDGVLYGLLDHEDRDYFEVSAVRHGLGSHDIRVGIGGLYDHFVLDKDLRNFIVGSGLVIPTGMFAPGGGIGSPPVIAPTSLQAWYVYLQDEWLIAPDWHLTTGLREDRYWSFGNTVNPRIGLVWVAAPAMSFKLLYATAFSPPGLTETSSDGIFGGLGNASLRPELSRDLELATTFERSGFRADAGVFRYWDSDLIQALPSAASVNGLEFFNRGNARGWGFESTLKYESRSGLSLSGTYAFHQFLSQDQNADPEVALAAKHQFTTEFAVPIVRHWTWEANTLSVLGRVRAIGDPRPEPANYTLVGSDIAWRSPGESLKVRAGARNLFNTDAHEANSTPQGIYYDLPLPGRELFASAQLRW